jgi:hypothetical protein
MDEASAEADSAGEPIRVAGERGRSIALSTKKLGDDRIPIIEILVPLDLML